MKPFYVYVITDGDVTLYVGKGTGRRHLASARKHGGIAEIREWFKNEDRAFARERELIAELSPRNNKCPGGYGGRATPKPAPPKTLWDKEFAEIERIGTRRYVAQFLLRNAAVIAKHAPASKLDISRLREVAYGCGA